MKKIEHEFASRKIDYITADSEVAVISLMDKNNLCLFKSEVKALAEAMGMDVVNGK